MEQKLRQIKDVSIGNNLRNLRTAEETGQWIYYKAASGHGT